MLYNIYLMLQVSFYKIKSSIISNTLIKLCSKHEEISFYKNRVNLAIKLDTQSLNTFVVRSFKINRANPAVETVQISM